MDINLILRQFGPLIFLFIIFYFLLIRPQQKREKDRKEMLNDLREGDQIVTIGGIYGKILEIKEDIVILEVGDKLKIKVAKTAIGNAIKK